MEFRKIDDYNSIYFKEVWNIYEFSFPSDERRELDQQKEIFKNNSYNFYVVFDSGKLIGLITCWDFPDFLYIEHLAVKESLRGQGLGKKVIKKILKKSNKEIFLEVDLPQADIAKRRITFYERLGFKLNEYKYIQPPYAPDKKPVDMLIMSYPKEITQERFSQIRKIIHKEVFIASINLTSPGSDRAPRQCDR